MSSKLRIGFIPEHFSSPLHFAQKHFSLDADLIPFPTGTGALTAALKDDTIDLAIGLTEGFVADLGKTHSAQQESPYGLAGTYVESPLCWAISTGADRSDVSSLADLRGATVGVSRIGSGSYVMSFVLADQQGWLTEVAGAKEGKGPFESLVPIGDFTALRKAVRGEGEVKADFFMWEHFTTKHFWDNGELKRVGEIYTPWASWMVAARKTVGKERLEEVLGKLNRGVEYYRGNDEKAKDYITTTMHYSREDATEWMKTVRFADDTRGVKPGVIDETVKLLQKAGVLQSDSGASEHMLIISRH